jgi:hypothetical protein
VRPACGLLIFGGAAARALPVRGGAFAGCALPKVRPSPWKLDDVLPKQLPMAAV